MKLISLDNGLTFLYPFQALQQVSYATIVPYMDNDLRQQIHSVFMPCSELELLTEYLKQTTDNIILPHMMLSRG